MRSISIIIIIAIACFLFGALSAFLLNDSVNGDPWKNYQRALEFNNNPANYEHDPITGGTFVTPRDVSVPLAMLVRDGELEEADIVLPTVLRTTDTTRAWMKAVQSSPNLIDAVGFHSDIYSQNPDNAIVHLRIWFRPGTGHEVTQLIHDLERVAALSDQSGGTESIEALDQLLFELLLADLAEQSLSFIPDIDDRTTILVHKETLGPPLGMLSNDQLSSELRERDWPNLIPLAAQLRVRNGETQSIPTLNSVAVDIVIADLDKSQSRFSYWSSLQEAYPGARFWVQLWLPAYSNDGNKALVRLWFGPTPHGATATYLFKRVDDEWVIDWCHFAYYA